MADAYAKLTGQPGVAFVTRGPGATNASIGVHTAYQDSTPIILFIGQVGSDMVEREAFQEVDYRRMFGEMSKWTAQIDRADRIPEYIAHAFQVATSGRQGPVVLALPEDMQAQESDVADAPCHQPVQAAPSDTQIATLAGHARPGAAAVRDPRRHRLDQRRVRRGAPLGRGQRAADRLRVPLSGPVRQPPSELRRRRRHRHQSEARSSACASPTS